MEQQIQDAELTQETAIVTEASQFPDASSSATDGSEANSALNSDAAGQDAQSTDSARVWSLSDIKHQWRKFNIDLMPKVHLSIKSLGCYCPVVSY
jgi:hypothetical protein